MRINGHKEVRFQDTCDEAGTSQEQTAPDEGEGVCDSVSSVFFSGFFLGFTRTAARIVVFYVF